MDVPNLLRNAAVMYRANVAVTCNGQRQTYAELWRNACRLANALSGAGLQSQDRVAVLGENTLETVEEAAGIALAGMVRSPLYTQNTPDVNCYLLKLIGAKALLVQDCYADELVALARDTVPSLEHIIVHHTKPRQRKTSGTIDYFDFLAGGQATDPRIIVNQGDDHIIRFSAGTTGRPKGIVHSVRGWMDVGTNLALLMPRIDESDCYIAAGPLSHATGILMWPVIGQGATIVVMPAFDPERFLDLVESERATMSVLVPTMIQMVAEVPGASSRDLSSLRAIIYGAAPITDRTLEAGLTLWGNIMYQLYGQSEALPATVLTPRYHVREGEGRRYLRSAGRPAPNSQVTIRNDRDEVLAIGEVGEVCVKCPGAMRGIWGDADATAARFTRDGSVRSRDLGHFDEDGFLYLDDRMEDLIISGGFNVYPAEVENALAAHPAVAEAVVFGVPHEKWGETVVGAVVLRENKRAAAEELIEWARERVGPVRKPTRIEFLSEPLPKSGVGKVLRRSVRERFCDDQRLIHGA